jgi:hypothetical protein
MGQWWWTVVVVSTCAVPGFAQLGAVSVGTGFTNPVFAASAPGSPGTLYVVQQGGAIRPLNVQTGTIGATMLNVSTVAGTNFISGGEQGLLGLAFHPNYQSNGLMYVKYTYNNGQAGAALRVEQYQVNQATGVADPASRRTVIQWDHDPTNTNHNAGWIGFNPANGTGANAGHLYINTGDGGGSNDPRNNGQNRNVLQGKILRLDVGNGLSATNPSYTIPTGNMTGTNTRPELFSYGLRNPYRASFDRATGNLYIGDVGQNTREEVNFIANGSVGGQNFGWRLREGTVATPTGGVGGAPPADNVDPIFDYVQGTNTGRSITGGNVYRGAALDTDGVTPLDGTYFFGDYISGRIWSFRYNGTTLTGFRERTTDLGLTAGQLNISSFAEDGFGNLYTIHYGGTVFRIVPVPEPASMGLAIGAGVAALAAWRRWKRLSPGAGRAGST